MCKHFVWFSRQQLFGDPMKSPNRSTFRKTLAVLATISLAFAGLSLGVAPASAAVEVSTNAGGEYTVTIGDSFNTSFLCQGNGGDTVFDTNYRQGTIPTGMTWNTGVLSGVATEVGDFTFGSWQCLYSNGSGSWQLLPGAYYWTTVHVIAVATPTPSITATSLNNSTCDVRIVASLPVEPTAGSAALRLENEYGYVTFGLRNYAAAELIDLSFSALDVTGLGLNQNVTSATPSADADTNFCATATTATLSYQYAGAPVASASAPVFTPSKLNTRPNVVVSAKNDMACTIHIVANYPSVQQGAQLHFYMATDTFGYDLYFTGVNSGEVFVADIPMMDEDTLANLPNLDHFTKWGDTPNCDSYWWHVDSNTNDAYGALVSSVGQVMPHLPGVAGIPCEPGTYSITGVAPCEPAAAGFYVDEAGATFAMPCNVGFFSTNLGSAFCQAAPIGKFVATTGATSAASCPAGQTTYLQASRSIHECYTLRVQTVKGVKVLKTYKYGTKIITPMLTDGGRALAVTAAGKCSVAVAKITIKVKGKNTKVDRYQIVAGKSAGSCTLTYTNAGDDTYKAITVVKTFKVSKTGK